MYFEGANKPRKHLASQIKKSKKEIYNTIKYRGQRDY